MGAWFLIVGVAVVAAITWLLYRRFRRGGRGAEWIWHDIGGSGFGEGDPRWGTEKSPLQGKWRLLAALALFAVLAVGVITIVLFWAENPLSP